MSGNHHSRVIIESIDANLRQTVKDIMVTLAPKTFSGANVFPVSLFRSFCHLVFEFVSNFGFRISDLTCSTVNCLLPWVK